MVNNINIKISKTLISIVRIYTARFEASFIMNSIEAINKNIKSSSISTTTLNTIS